MVAMSTSTIFEGLDTAVSMRIEHNIAWSRQEADRGLIIHQFDQTVDALPPDDPRMIFNKTMIAPSMERVRNRQIHRAMPR
jgi:hypothetical protein